jgi:hypothetical protein
MLGSMGWVAADLGDVAHGFWFAIMNSPWLEPCSRSLS